MLQIRGEHRAKGSNGLQEAAGPHDDPPAWKMRHHVYTACVVSRPDHSPDLGQRDHGARVRGVECAGDDQFGNDLPVISGQKSRPL